MENIWDVNPLKSVVFGRCGRDEKTNDHAELIKVECQKKESATTYFGTFSQPSILIPSSVSPFIGDLRYLAGRGDDPVSMMEVKCRAYSVGSPQVGWVTVEHFTWQTMEHSVSVTIVWAIIWHSVWLI